ncbi:uncharacterized protein LOC125070833 [Vanessa atalanta]|uniref:uncharacterized protein LOC125070833 n=1 Tax=Vanessa atalanta TaxID=42275 RepID=UPI001FCD54E0|nr:uncharacterized protein LOC125070833 [Vanessa atalanta]
MEQMYLVEIFIDKVTIFVFDDEESSGANKKLIVKIRFGPKVEFIIKEGQLALNENTKDDIIECDDSGRRKWSRTIRVGKSYLFPSYSDTVLMILSKFPLEIEIWNDDENEVDIFVGIGTMHWETEFFHMLKETAVASKIHEPLTIKQNTPLFAECCCKQVGEISFILRLSALGESIITEFQQLMKDPDTFVFRTNKAPSMFQCKRVEGDDPNFCMVGSLYETTTLEDPTLTNNAQEKIEICTELQSCGVQRDPDGASCKHDVEDTEAQLKKSYPIDKIRMGDITGPCGNANCPLAHKVRTYIRNLETYKREAAGKVTETKGDVTRKVCGTCVCKDDRWHREECPEMLEKEGKQGKVVCSGCGGTTQAGETCDEQQKKLGMNPNSNKTVAYIYSVTNVPGFNVSLNGKQFITENLKQNCYYQSTPGNEPSSNKVGCSCGRSGCTWSQFENTNLFDLPTIPLNTKNSDTRNKVAARQALVYNFDVKESKRKLQVFDCVEIADDKDCKCNPPKPSPPCKTFDCECMTETTNVAARKSHRPYCPSYKHKANCPVTMMQEDEEKKKAEDDEDEAEPLPYGLPPIKLGPCPVLGRPCCVPDGFARMYKTAALPAQPPSYSDAGKVCCSKEYERIKKAIKDYMKYEKDHDFRCVNKFNVDTERRCCDKEQRLLSLMGKECCGSHKLAIQEKFKEEKNP